MQEKGSDYFCYLPIILSDSSQASLTITQATGGTITAAPDGPYDLNDGATLTATPAAGYNFSAWTGDCIDETANTCVLTMDAAKNVSAIFTQNDKALTITQGTGGTITAAPDGPYHLNDEVSLTVTPAAGYSFSAWTGDCAGQGNPCTLTMDTAKSVSATFTQDEYALTITQVTGGTITAAPDSPYQLNDGVNLTATPAAGYSFSAWTGDCAGQGNPCILTMDAAKSVSATFTQNDYTLSIVSDHGTVSVDPDQATYTYDTDVLLTMESVETGWTFTGWSGGDCTGTSPCTVNITDNTTVTANFTQDEFSLSVGVVPVDSGNSVTLSNSGPYHYNDEVTLEAVTIPGWQFDHWVVGSDVVYASEIVVTITDHVVVSAYFTQIEYALTITQVTGGTITAPPDGPYHLNDGATLTATPAAGYSFSAWTGDCAGQGNPCTLTMDADMSVSATFTLNEYALTITQTTGGTITVAPAGPYHLNDGVTLTATPAAGYSFSTWTGDCVGQGNPCTLTMDAAKSVSATFTRNEYALTITQVTGGTITTDPAGPYHLNDEVTLTATLDAGYSFSGWTGNCAGQGNPCTLTMDAAKSVSATLTHDEYALTIIESTGVTISVSSEGPYHLDDQVTLTPIVDYGYTFTGWTGDASGTNVPLNITLRENLTIGASTDNIPASDAYYVSTSGSDANPGTFESPFLTIQHAIDLANDPGDLILVMPGEYRSSSYFRIENKNGLPGQEIVIRAFDPNQKPMIINHYAGFRVINSSYVTIDGFEFKDYIATGVAVYLSDNITIQNNYMHLSFEGICQSGEGLPKCKPDNAGLGQVKGRVDDSGNYILEHDGSQNTGIYMCKTVDSLISGNKIEHTDEGIYIGTAGQITTNSCGTSYEPQTWSSGNVVENNIIFEAMNEGVELKPDAIRTTVRNNVLKNSAGQEFASIEIRSAYNDVYGNVIFGDNQYSRTGIRLVDETLCTNPPNDEFGNSMLLYPKSTGYICNFGNLVHHNYIYYMQGTNSVPAINNHVNSAGNTLDHNTVVGGRDYGIISSAVSSIITNNLIVGDRGTTASLFSQVASYKPVISDYNAFYPSQKYNGSCTVIITGESIICENGLNDFYEANSVFMPSSPLGTFQPATSPIKIDGECSPSSLSSLPLEELGAAITSCSIPLDNAYGNQIVNNASDGTTIGASQIR